MANEFSSIDELHLLRSATLDWRLNRGALGVFAVILKHCNPQRCSWPGEKRISTMAGIADRNITTAIGRLEQLGYLKVERSPGKVNRYLVLDSPRIPTQTAVKAQLTARHELGMRASGVGTCSKAGTRLKPPTNVSGVLPVDSAQTPDEIIRPTPDETCSKPPIHASSELAFNSPTELRQRRMKNGDMPQAAAECFAAALGGVFARTRDEGG